MDAIKNITLGILHGLWDSIRGMTLILHIDAEIHRLQLEKEAERLDRRMQRSPSPTPSSASAMEREERENLLARLEFRSNPDERSLESVRKKHTTPEEQKPKGEKKIAKQVLKCCLLNGGFTWLSIILFEQMLLPTLKFVLTLFYGEHSQDLNMIWGWLQSVLSIIFGMMWVLPIFLLSKIVSSLWFADIANAAYRVRKGRPQMIPNISKLIADFLFSLLVQALFLVQSMLVNLLPMAYIGSVLCFVHLCLLYSLYCFEYKWFNMGWELHRRLSYIENNWPYFMGFGIPLTVLTNMSSSLIVSSCIFSIFFPLFILSGNEAKPLVGTTETPLRLFSPVIFASNLFFNRSGDRAAKVAQQNHLQQQLLLKQQNQQQFIRQRSERREPQEQSRQSPQRSHRYQQPPLRRTHTSATPSPVRHTTPPPVRYIGGPRPLIPTPVAAPPPTASQPTARHR